MTQIIDPAPGDKPKGVENKVVIVGGGPAGLSAAINIAYEGTEVVLIDNKPGLGGQARESTKIRNYMGFPDGVAGKDLIAGSVNQAASLGVEIVSADVVNIVADQPNYIIETDRNDVYTVPAVIIATGLLANRLNAKNAGRYTGYGLNYNRPNVLDRAAGQCFIVIGGGNSAGQAAQFLASIDGCSVKMIVRGSSLETMSATLLADIRKGQNIDIMFNSEVIEVLGDTNVKAVVVKTQDKLQTLDTVGVWVFIGGSPRTYWLKDSEVHLNQKGYIVPARMVPEKWKLPRAPFAYETTAPGVFALGDVRVDSGRRIATAVGEGSAIAPIVYNYIRGLNNHNGNGGE